MASDASGPPIELVAVINSFNRLPLLREALGTLTDALDRAPELRGAIVVYEAGSTDGSGDFLSRWAAEHPTVPIDVVHPEAGSGTSFSDGVNAGCTEALRRFPHARWLLLYESDNWIAGPTPLFQARALLEERSELAATGWTVRRHAGGEAGYGMCFPYPLAMAAGRNLCLSFNLEGPNRTPWQRTGSGIEWRRCDVVFTSPLLIRRSAWEAAGGFDAEAFPFSDSDLDWAWRCLREGIGGQAVVRSDDVVHDNRAQPSAWSDDRVVRFQFSRMALLKRYRGRFRTNAVKPLLFFRHAVESVILAAAFQIGRPGASAKLAKRLEMLRSVWRDYQPAK